MIEGDDADDALDGPGKGKRPRPGSSEDHDDDDDEDETSGCSDPDGKASKEPKPSPHARNDADVKLLRTYLNASVKEGDFITIDTEPDDSFKVLLSVYQVLQKEKRHMQVTRFGVKADEAKPLFKVSVQKFEELFSPRRHLGYPSAVDVFRREDPSKCDILSICGVQPSDRSRVRVWQVREADVQDCVNLHSPSMLRCHTPLSSPDCPALCLMDALENAHMVGVSNKVTHTPDSTVMQFDNRQPRTSYFRCVLARNYLFKHGCKLFESAGLVAYYEALLRFPATTEPGQAQTVHKGLLTKKPIPYAATLDDDLCSNNPVPSGLKMKVRLAPSSPGSIGGASSSEPRPKKKEPSRSSSSSSSSSESSSSSSSKASKPDDGFPAKLFGEVLQRKLKNGVQGFNVICPNVRHRRGKGCTKFRSRHIDIDKHGVKSPEYYLGCWMLEAYNMDQETHRAWRPSVRQVAAHKEVYSGELG